MTAHQTPLANAEATAQLLALVEQLGPQFRLLMHDLDVDAGARAAHERYPLGQMMPRGGATPFDQSSAGA